jgi:predicted dehydrogenase
MMGFCYYWLPSLRAFVESLQHVRICGVQMCSGQALQAWHEIDYRDRYHGTPGLGGVLNDTVSHLLFVARWLLGDLRLRAAVASRFSGLDIQTEDTAALLLESPQGQPCTIWADYMQKPKATRMSVLTSEGMRAWAVGTEELAQMYERQMQVFCEVCEGGRTYGYPTLADGQAVQRILDAVHSGDRTSPHGVNAPTW